MKTGALYFVILSIFFVVASCWPEVFSSIGKYDAGKGGFLLPGIETLLIDQEGPGYISHFQFAADEFPGYSSVNFLFYFLLCLYWSHKNQLNFKFYYDDETESSFTSNLFDLMYHSSEPLFGTNSKGTKINFLKNKTTLTRKKPHFILVSNFHLKRE